MTKNIKTEFFSQIASCRIHPGIGIARVGDSPTEFFLGPEAPGHPPFPNGGFKDDHGRIKRQGARFRIYAYNSDGIVIAELTADDAIIQWKVHLANKKASWEKFSSRFDKKKRDLRNSNIKDKSILINDPGARLITGTNQSGKDYQFDTGSCFGVKLSLGELQTDEKGRLIILGGAGHSGSPQNYSIVHFANNNNWYDDTSDGPVTARVVLKDGRVIPVKETAWIIVAPPKFAPHNYPIVTLYDVMREIALKEKWIPNPDYVSFTRDIYPIFARTSDFRWLNASANRGHGSGTGGDFAGMMKKLSDKSKESNSKLRQSIFLSIRVPEKLDPSQANWEFMPQLSGDGGDALEEGSIGDPTKWMTILESQYGNMEKWAAGEFEDDWSGQPPEFPTFEDIPLQEQPDAIDRAPLELSIGGPFHPGIEITHIALDPKLYAGKPFRINSKLQPGDITKYMAIPWQADFFECKASWWPATRPDDVLSIEKYEEFLQRNQKIVSTPTQQKIIGNGLAERVNWFRGLNQEKPPLTEMDPLPFRPTGDTDMVKFWSKLGFVVQKITPDGSKVFVETERGKFEDSDD